MNQSWSEAGAPDAGRESIGESTQASAKPGTVVNPSATNPSGLSDSEQVLGLINDFREESFDDQVDDQDALRWRRALLRLSETFLDAAEERRDLSPILLGALHNALEQLLIHGNDDDLMSLEEWLSHEAPTPMPIQDAVSEAARSAFAGVERRKSAQRRCAERRQADRRQSRADRRNSNYSSPHSSSGAT